MTGFRAGENMWTERLGSLRNVVRQEVIARQIAPLVRRFTTVLDVGCGQGTQALRLASSGCAVTAVDPSPSLLDRCGEDARARRLDIELLRGRIEDLGDLCGRRTFDLVCCHGVMMYLDDSAGAVADLGRRSATDGHVSVSFRNGDALAMRPGLRSDWTAALAAFDSTRYVNELGVSAHAVGVGEIREALATAGLRPVTWYGVRVFTDALAADAAPPDLEIWSISSMRRSGRVRQVRTSGWRPSSTSSPRRRPDRHGWSPSPVGRAWDGDDPGRPGQRGSRGGSRRCSISSEPSEVVRDAAVPSSAVEHQGPADVAVEGVLDW